MENQTENEELKNKPEVDTNEVEAELAAEAEQKDEYKEKYFYLAAEMQNLQKRYDREKQNLIKYGNENILRDLVEVVDNFERTIDAIRNDEDEKMKNLVVGIDMINKQFMNTLSKYGLTKVEAEGKIFDPNFHEALAQVKMDGKKELEIIQVHQHGYTLNERLIRSAKVVVAKNEE